MFFVLPQSGTWLAHIVGLIMAVVGLVIVLYAIFEHQRVGKKLPNVAPTPKEGGNLITSGLYTYIRHPIYSGVLLGAFGIAVFQGEIVTFLLAVALYILFSIKSRYEESLLKTTFAGYAQYMTRTGRFIPGLNL
ncbi:isoprenylcysteine carboxylmethyltransferase family protein [Phototrophicus methaneseepsis]|uniref:Isoprenylcysteine carboxylmethyltransferase family protein n=1 Tax=Phototrophicus methaneseepsis TaxID=2710758 RepID=A0A7S8IF26_9CHLR|nr:isoprenylcysteine carboxylmethyltransferase family protein [Phototrophicus methaneseepsis]QPC82483.1 isoprenylcysteine carboxylmethyltransferase family protein [Phototrophicus methaneseepsis]